MKRSREQAENQRLRDIDKPNRDGHSQISERYRRALREELPTLSARREEQRQTYDLAARWESDHWRERAEAAEREPAALREAT